MDPFPKGVAAAVNAEKVTHIKVRWLKWAVIFINYVTFQNWNFSERKEFAPRGSEFFPLRAFPYGMEKHYFRIRSWWFPLKVKNFHLAHRYLRNRSYAYSSLVGCLCLECVTHVLNSLALQHSKNTGLMKLYISSTSCSMEWLEIRIYFDIV